MNTNRLFRLTIQKNSKEYCLFTTPQTNEYQSISNLKLSPQPYKVINDKKYNNKIVCFKMDDISNQAKISFNYMPHSINKKIDQKFSLNNYKSFLLTSNKFIDGFDKQVMKMAKDSLKKEVKLLAVAKNLYDFSISYLNYGSPILGLYPYWQGLKEKTTDCGGFSTFLLSLFQSVGIPGRIVVGFIIKNNFVKNLLSRFKICPLNFKMLLMHAWLEILLPDNAWFPMDPSIEWRRNHGQTKRKGGFGFIPDDRLVVTMGEDFKIKIDNKNYYVDIFQHPVYL